MHFQELEIVGSWLIEPEPFVDNRGIFRRSFCAKEFADHGINTSIMQCNISENPIQHTLRGFHYQLAPHGEGKTISCFSGGLYDIIVDLRPDSKTHLKWISISIDARNKKSIYVPPGCANAYLTMEQDTFVHYYMTELYMPESYRGFCFNDPNFNFVWPALPALISEKDKNLPFFDSSLSNE